MKKEILPKRLQLDANTQKTIFVESLPEIDVFLSENSSLDFVVILKKGWRGGKKLRFYFEGEGGEVNFVAVILAKGEEKFLFETESIHNFSNTKANFSVRCAMFDKAKVDYRGAIKVKPGTKMTDAYLSHHSLMLSEDAVVKTLPAMDVETDNVKAGHAVTVGKVDPETLFYLNTRGMSKKESEKILIKSFLETDLKKISDGKFNLKSL